MLELVVFSYNKKDWKAFHKYRLEHLNAPSLYQYAKTNSLILDYSGSFYWNQNKLDSAYYYYYKAYKSYHVLKDSLRAGNMLLNTAIIQKNSRDYTGSEAASFKTLPYLEAAKNNRRVASTFNNLGIIYMYFEDYENAIKYHTKSYNIRNGLTKNRILELHSLNNIGNVYKEKKQFKKAISYYTKALAKDSILQKHPKIKAMLIDNYAHARFLDGDYKLLPQSFIEALRMRDSINDVSGKIVNYIHLGEYYKKTGNIETAKRYFEKAKKTAETISYPRDQIEAMQKLSDIYPSTKALKTAKRIIYLQDSIQKVDRKVKDQYSRTRYETLEKEKAIEKLRADNAEKEIEIKSKKLNNWILGTGTAITLLVLIILISRLKKRKKELEEEKTRFLEEQYRGKQLQNLVAQLQNKKKQIAGIDDVTFHKFLERKLDVGNNETEVYLPLVQGKTRQEIADQLFMSLSGTKTRIDNLYNALKIYTNTKETKMQKSQAMKIFNDLYVEYQLTKKNNL